LNLKALEDAVVPLLLGKNDKVVPLQGKDERELE